MTEQDALDYLQTVPRETIARMDAFVSLLSNENERQNLIAASTLSAIWSRHIVDSAQLLDLAQPGPWIDLGSGAGFPGLIIASVGERQVSLVESRARRIAFLRQAADVLDIADRIEILGQRLETIAPRPFAVISARAFAPLTRLFNLAHFFSTSTTLWLLPKGRGAATELEAARGSWQGDFRIVPSITDPDSAIIVASDVRRRARR